MADLRKLLLIFVKNPLLGKVKTRLATTIGDTKALEIYKQLLMHTMAITKEVNADKAVFYSDFIGESDVWHEAVYQKYLQQGPDLGQRMDNAFCWAFEQPYEQVVIIGSDCPQLTTSIIHQAYEALQTSQAVIGPAVDGGYYLLGLKRTISQLFTDKAWSSPTVFADTVTDLQKLQLPYRLLPLLHDVDYEQDLALLDFVHSSDQSKLL